MCCECGHDPCSGQCPNAEPEPRGMCPVCHTAKYAEEVDLHTGVCDECRDKKRSFETYMDFARKNIPQFLDDWYIEDHLNSKEWGAELQKKIGKLLFSELYLRYFDGDFDEREYLVDKMQCYADKFITQWLGYLKGELSNG